VVAAFWSRIGGRPRAPEMVTGTPIEILGPRVVGRSRRVREAHAWLALRRVGLHRVVRSLPLGLRTTLIRGGSSLSGGEMRRLAMARAVVAEHDFLVLDEPWVGLSEQNIQTMNFRCHLLPNVMISSHQIV